MVCCCCIPNLRTDTNLDLKPCQNSPNVNKHNFMLEKFYLTLSSCILQHRHCTLSLLLLCKDQYPGASLLYQASATTAVLVGLHARSYLINLLVKAKSIYCKLRWRFNLQSCSNKSQFVPAGPYSYLQFSCLFDRPSVQGLVRPGNKLTAAAGTYSCF